MLIGLMECVLYVVKQSLPAQMRSIFYLRTGSVSHVAGHQVHQRADAGNRPFKGTPQDNYLPRFRKNGDGEPEGRKALEGGVEPKSIVAFAFIEKAAEQLKTRIRGILEARCPNRADFGVMYVGTIHAFCFYMLKEIDPTFRSYDVLDDPRRVVFLSKYQTYYKSVGLNKLEDEHKFKHYQTIYKFIEAVDIITTEDIDPSDLSVKVGPCHYRHSRRLQC
jgi:hypothetical protein